jgi:hypothetical protein
MHTYYQNYSVGVRYLADISSLTEFETDVGEDVGSRDMDCAVV